MTILFLVITTQLSLISSTIPLELVAAMFQEGWLGEGRLSKLLPVTDPLHQGIFLLPATYAQTSVPFKEVIVNEAVEGGKTDGRPPLASQVAGMAYSALRLRLLTASSIAL